MVQGQRRAMLASAILCASVRLCDSNALGAQTAATWIGDTDGSWIDAARWSTFPAFPLNGSPPGTTYDVQIIATGNPYAVSLDQSVLIDRLTLGAAATLWLGGNGTLNVVGPSPTVSGPGKIQLNGASISGGTLSNGGGVLVGGTLGTSDSDLTGVFIDTEVMIPSTRKLLLRGNSTLGPAGKIRLNGQQNSLDVGSLLAGQGEVIFDGASGETGNIRLDINQNVTVIDNGIRIRTGTANGQIGGNSGEPVENRGVVTTDTAGNRITLMCTTNNTGSIHASNGGRVQFFGFSNSGSISADGGTLMVSSLPASVGSFSVSNGGLVVWGSNLTTARIRALDVTNSVYSMELGGGANNTGSTIAVHDGSNLWQLAGGGIAGGTVTSPDNAPLPVLLGANSISNVDLNADVSIAGGASLELTGSTLTAKTIRLGATPTKAATLLSPGMHLSAGASVIFDNSANNRLSGPSQSGIAIPAGVSVATGTGGGRVGADFDAVSSNAGLISAQTPNQPIELHGLLTNLGTIRAIDGGNLAAINVGAGSIAVNGARVTNQGLVHLGSNCGFSITGSFVQSPAGMLEFELGGVAPGNFGVIVATRSIQLDGALNIALLSGYEPQLGDAFPIMQASTGGNITGMFSQTTFPSLSGEKAFAIAYSASDVTLTVIPEPALSVLAGAAIFALSARRLHAVTPPHRFHPAW